MANEAENRKTVGPHYFTPAELKSGGTRGYREVSISLVDGGPEGLLRYKAPTVKVMREAQKLGDGEMDESAKIDYMIRVLADSIVDESGQQIFTVDDIDEMSFDTMNRLLAAVTGQTVEEDNMAGEIDSEGESKKDSIPS